MTPDQFRGLVKHWERVGRSDFLQYLKNIIPPAEKGLLGSVGSSEDVSLCLYRLILAGTDGTLKKESVSKTLAEAVALHPDLPAQAVDIFGMLEVEMSANDDPKNKERLYWIIKSVEGAVSNQLLRERMEVESFPHIGVVKNPKAFNSKFIKLKTKLYYKQRKFNLFREESEGYAKLLVELNQEQPASSSPEQMLEIIKSVIGCFNLDPNRVLDLLLSSLEARPERHGFLVGLLRLYMPSAATVSEMVGAKYGFCRRQPGQEEAEAVTPRSLHLMTALLLRHGVIQLEHIWPWLLPADSAVEAEHRRQMAAAAEYQRRTFVVSTKDKEDSPRDAELPPLAPLSQSQKLGLCEAVLSVGDWATAQRIMARFPDFCLMVHPDIAAAACRLLAVRLDPIYRRYSGLTAALEPAPQLADVRSEVAPLLSAIGPYLAADVRLVYKVLRVARTAHRQRLQQPEPDSPETREAFLFYDVLTILEESVLPCLVLLEANCCLAEEIWTVLNFYPYQHRYRLYGTWKNDSHKPHPQLMRKRADFIKMSKSLMKRISKENVKPLGRLMGKLTHNAPGYMFEYMLGQIQIYDNLIGPMVDSLKYITNLSYDVLGYCIIEALANPEKDRTKHDGTSLSLWLTSLANFCGAMFKKYNLDLTGLMQYVANQLKSMKSLDLLILREVVQKMAGVEAVEDMTEEQLSAMAGGEMLRAEAGFFNQVRNTKKSSQRLKDSLIDNGLMVPMVLLMAQQRHCVVFKETEGSHLKLVGKLYDQCQDTMVQFGMFLSSALSIDDYRQRLPAFEKLLSEFHVSPDVAFFLARPMFTHAIQQRYDELRKAEKNHKSLSVEQKRDKYLAASEQVLAPVVAAVVPVFPAKTWDDISPEFFTSFWSLTLSDLRVPTESYEKEVRRLKQQATQLGDNRDLTESKRKKEQERCQALIDKLHEEEKRQKEHVDRVIARLKKEKDSWFEPRQAKSAKTETMTQFVQMCLFPRCVFTSMDALYCAEFVHTLHSLKTPNFSTLICYDRLFCNITYTFTSCTENEASRYGRFLCALLETVMRWHGSREVFERECAFFPGFVTKFRVSNKQNERSDHVDYENYRHVCFKWFYKITKAIVTCLDSKEYVQIRNALKILIKILPCYPVLSHVANIVEKKVEAVIQAEKNKRQDLALMATSYAGLLRARKTHLIPEKDFHTVDKSKRETPDNADRREKRDGRPRERAKDDETRSRSGTPRSDRAGARERKHDSSEERRDKKASKHSTPESETKRESDEIRVVEDEYFEKPRRPAGSAVRSLPEASDVDREAKRRRVESTVSQLLQSSKGGTQHPGVSRPLKLGLTRSLQCCQACSRLEFRCAVCDGLVVRFGLDARASWFASHVIVGWFGFGSFLSPKMGSDGRHILLQRLDKMPEKDEEKKKKRKKSEKGLEEGEIRNKREDKKERKRASLDDRGSPIESKRKKDDDKPAKRRSEGDEFREVKDKRRQRREEEVEFYDEPRYAPEYDWERERERPPAKEKHRGRMDSKRR
ncbi:LOW QUALITY PROTEIN: THO complex subunit 2-like [Pollicipes pollicipes]|uniref:LOW QUALITY PROTEIN: THO complex subunit 2-like n=1 Tax=Pollicipes pollicipes TaxID=41117 RepID=UPI001884F84A|nr:LOW QUALITY PROTEIN: THO complex subunit 2-like [Pollicipes pollicipes]